METAKLVSRRSTCFRLNVGAVVVVNDRPVSWGYNGSPPGEPHCAGNECPGRFACTETTHAEDNALRYVPKGVQPEDIYITDSPCLVCAHLIVASGIKRVFFDRPYRIGDGIHHLINRSIAVYQVTSSGYVIEWPTKELVEL